MKMFTCKFAQDEVTHQRLRVGSKKHALSLPEGSVQQCRSHFYARSVCVICEHGKMARTPLAAFFNRPRNISSSHQPDPVSTMRVNFWFVSERVKEAL